MEKRGYRARLGGMQTVGGEIVREGEISRRQNAKCQERGKSLGLMTKKDAGDMNGYVHPGGGAETTGWWRRGEGVLLRLFSRVLLAAEVAGSRFEIYPHSHDLCGRGSFLAGFIAYNPCRFTAC